MGKTSSLQPSVIPPTSRADAAASMMIRDQSCRLSNHRDCVSYAHLCPRAELDWFRNNQMGRYSLEIESNSIDDIGNIILLRYDLRRDFDNGKFIFIPKKSESTSETAIVAHVLEPTHELGLLYHNTQLHPMPGVPWVFFLARFAWAIFPSVQPFLECGIPRLLIRTKTAGDQRAIETDAATCYLLAHFSKSPGRKRKRISNSSTDR